VEMGKQNMFSELGVDLGHEIELVSFFSLRHCHYSV
jgi:hypothetical protein